MRAILKALAVIVSCVGALVVFSLSTREVVTVHAVSDLPLYDPTTMAGQWGDRPTIVGTVKAGQIVAISGCNPRKSDIDLETIYQGRKAVVGGEVGAFVIQRRRAGFNDSNVTSSCYGLFSGKDAI